MLTLLEIVGPGTYAMTAKSKFEQCLVAARAANAKLAELADDLAAARLEVLKLEAAEQVLEKLGQSRLAKHSEIIVANQRLLAAQRAIGATYAEINQALDDAVKAFPDLRMMLGEAAGPRPQHLRGQPLWQPRRDLGEAALDAAIRHRPDQQRGER
ncbi:hypothetical protein [Bradyrhizobium quebecense]|uniref:Phasin domain-containing protein n=2 Tax=Bradyrhizobium quebecense TaxID=2748629 RepID=A0ABS3M8S7_9BRAD|nr:hypothetical protein [Bradyrhizobium quebecense]UGY03273.1 hypothetical protein J4P68_0000375 [Bradyrhizobium quebecense]